MCYNVLRVRLRLNGHLSSQYDSHRRNSETKISSCFEWNRIVSSSEFCLHADQNSNSDRQYRIMHDSEFINQLESIMHSGNPGETGILHARRGSAGSAEPTWALSEWLTTKRD
eukprot:COSAG02_NODE_8317_length_2618_cov_317.236602_3_plen_113_part_00